jgi:hypothetical protein
LLGGLDCCGDQRYMELPDSRIVRDAGTADPTIQGQRAVSGTDKLGALADARRPFSSLTAV